MKKNVSMQCGTIVTNGVANLIVDAVQKLPEFQERFATCVRAIPNLTSFLVGDVQPLTDEQIMKAFTERKANTKTFVKVINVEEVCLEPNLIYSYKVRYEKYKSVWQDGKDQIIDETTTDCEWFHL